MLKPKKSKRVTAPQLQVKNLRKYQWRLFWFVVNNHFCALFVDMGLGKTISVLSAIKHLFHRGELTRPVLVIAPIRVIYSVWRQEAIKWKHTESLTFSLVHGGAKRRMEALSRPAHIYLINPEGVTWLIAYYMRLSRHKIDVFQKKWPFQMLVLDECFIAETLVRTPTGLVRIDSLKIGDLVVSSAGVRPVVLIKSRTPKRLIQIHLSNDEVITCTPEHRFFTPIGWVEAELLNGNQIITRSEMSGLWTTLHGATDASAEQQRSWSENDVLEEMCSDTDVANSFRREVSCPPKESIKIYDRQTCMEQGSPLGRADQVKVECSVSVSKAGVHGDTSRQRYRDDQGRILVVDGATGNIYLGVPNFFRRATTWISNLLQGRLRRSEDSTSDRDRRHSTPKKTSATTRSQEGNQVGRVWVDRVTAVEPGSIQDVWNLEVEGCPHFYVGKTEVLVHNSTFFKDSGTQRFKALRKALPLFERRVILTGTPTPNSLLQLWAQMFIVDLGEALMTAYTAFRDRYFEKKDYMGYHFALRDGARQAIGRKLRGTAIRLHDKDWLELPKLVKQQIRVELPVRAMTMYERFEEEMFLELETAEVEALSAATLTQRCHQIANGAIYALDKETAVKDWHVIHDAKVDALKELLEELGEERCIISYTFKHDLARLRALLPEVPVMGPKNTERLIQEWIDGDHQRMFVHPQSGSHGVNNMQVRCRRVVFFSIPWSGEHHDQLVARVGPARRTGEVEPTIVHYLVAHKTVDEAIVSALERKAAGQADLLNALKNYRDDKENNALGELA